MQCIFLHIVLLCNLFGMCFEEYILQYVINPRVSRGAEGVSSATLIKPLGYTLCSYVKELFMKNKSSVELLQ